MDKPSPEDDQNMVWDIFENTWVTRTYWAWVNNPENAGTQEPQTEGGPVGMEGDFVMYIIVMESGDLEEVITDEFPATEDGRRSAITWGASRASNGSRKDTYTVYGVYKWGQRKLISAPQSKGVRG